MKGVDDTIYVGDWKRNKREGHGVYFTTKMLENPILTNFEYCGGWLNNKKHGIGFFVVDGEIICAQFEDDSIVEVVNHEISFVKKGLIVNLKMKRFVDVLVSCNQDE
jgi:hypothetical protein